jgi:hypothetical protein
VDLDEQEFARLSVFGRGCALMPPRPLPRYRVTRRGNVYDGIARRTVFASWGMASVRDRHAIAQAWIRRQVLGEVLAVETALEYPEASR